MRRSLNAAQIARVEKVHKTTVSRWIKKGLFEKAFWDDTTHQYLIPLSSYEKFKRKRQQS